MRSKLVNVFWGFILIAVGGLLLAERMDWIHFRLFSEQGWMLAFGVASAIFFCSYFLNGIRHWGWLFPALICAAIALTIWMGEADIDSSIMGVPVLAALTIPFYVGFLVDRKKWGLLIPAWIMTIVTILTLFAEQADAGWIGALFLFAAAAPFLAVFLMDRSRRWALIPAWILIALSTIVLMSDSAAAEWIGALVQFAIALPFFVVYLLNRSRRWALIPAWIMTIIGVIVLLSTFPEGDWIGTLVMYAIGLPFLVVYLRNRSRKWAIIPAIVMGVLGTIPLMTTFLGDDAIAPAIMFLFAAPFFALYFWQKKQWWALLPAGMFASIGLVVILSYFEAGNHYLWEGILRGVLLLGFGLTFGALWLRRASLPTDWAKYPAVGLMATAIMAFFLGRDFWDYWAVILMIVGILLIVANLLPGKSKGLTPPANPS